MLRCASLLAAIAIAILSLPSIISVEAAETAKAMLKDAKSLKQTSAGVLLQLSLKGVPAESMPFTSMPWASASRPASNRLAGISIQAARTMG